jgi:signal transduction histidine kinase
VHPTAVVSIGFISFMRPIWYNNLTMEFLRTFFDLNRDIIYFGYGLVFFVLGLAIALQSRSYSRLDLARSLRWLAAFGFAHGLHEWGDLFIPQQALYLTEGTVLLLEYLHHILLALSYAFLFQFGEALLRPLGSPTWLRYISTVLFLAWLLTTFIVLPALYPDPGQANDVSNALARYAIGFTGGMLAAYGLRRHTMQRISALDVPHIVRMLRFAGVMLALYAIFGGLIPPPVPFFPGNILNSVNFEEWFIAPPPVFRSLIGLGLTIAVIRALEVFDVETARMIESIEQQQILIAERARIARDLHDGAIQKVYTAGLLVESAHKLSDGEDSVLASRLSKAEAVLNDAIVDLRHNLSELHTLPTAEPFRDALQAVADDPRFRSLVDVSLEMDLKKDEVLSPARAEHLLSVVKEALSNVVRHSRANRVSILLSGDEQQLHLSIQDDGIGLPDPPTAGFGLRNMRDRARLLGGQIKFSSIDGRGTLIILDIPWKDER